MKLNKKGFTLIELLAVIVILGVLMIVAVPAIGGVINNSRQNAMISSAKMYISTAQNLAAEDLVDGSSTLTLCYDVDNKDSSPFPDGTSTLTGRVEYASKKWTAYITDGTRSIKVESTSKRTDVFNTDGTSKTTDGAGCSTGTSKGTIQ